MTERVSMSRQAAKRTVLSERFANVSNANTDLARSMIQVAQKLSESGNTREAKLLIAMIEDLLKSNYELQQLMSDVLLEESA